MMKLLSTNETIVATLGSVVHGNTKYLDVLLPPAGKGHAFRIQRVRISKMAQTKDAPSNS